MSNARVNNKLNKLEPVKRPSSPLAIIHEARRFIATPQASILPTVQSPRKLAPIAPKKEEQAELKSAVVEATSMAATQPEEKPQPAKIIPKSDGSILRENLNLLRTKSFATKGPLSRRRLVVNYTIATRTDELLHLLQNDESPNSAEITSARSPR